MATIPVGSFGNAVARPLGPVSIPSGDALAPALNRTGEIAQGLATDEMARQTHLDEMQRVAAASLALAKTTNAMHDAHDEVAKGVLDGSIGTDKAAGELQKRVGTIRDTALQGYAPEQRDSMDAHLTAAEGALGRNLTGIVQKRQQHDIASTIDQFGEQVSREAARQGPGWAVQKFGAMVDFTGDAAGFNEAQKSKLKQNFSEKAHATFFESAGLAALTNGDAPGLRALREQVAGTAGDPLDPQKRNVLVHQLFGWEQYLLAKQDRAANQAEEEQRKRYNEAVTVYNQGTDVALGGGYFSPEFITQMTTSAAGTEMAGPVADLIASQRMVAGFASRSAPDRAAMIERMRAARATPGQGVGPAEDRLLGALSTMDSKLRSQADDNPWAAAQQAGVIQNAPVFSAVDPTSVQNVVRQRMAAIGGVETWAGKRVSPLQPEEVVQLGKLARQLPIDQAATMLAGIGASVGDSERVAALGKQLHDKDGALGLAMLYASSQTTQGRYTAELVLRGDQAIRDKSVTIDKAAETGWQGAIAKQIRGAYSNREAEDQVIDAAFKISAALYAKDGSPDIDRAVRLASGGITERNGQKVPIPYGMSESDFDKRIKSITAADIGGAALGPSVYAGRAPIPVQQFIDSLPQATLIHAGQGLYNVRAGSTLVTDSAGNRITIKVRP